jgi:hypothetical protein
VQCTRAATMHGHAMHACTRMRGVTATRSLGGEAAAGDGGNRDAMVVALAATAGASLSIAGVEAPVPLGTGQGKVGCSCKRAHTHTHTHTQRTHARGPQVCQSQSDLRPSLDRYPSPS